MRRLKGLTLNGDGGFTLLEVMASIAILGACVFVIIQVFSGGLRLSKSSTDNTGMLLFAKEKAAEAILDEALEPGSKSGVADGLEWKVDVSPFEISGVDAGVLKIDIEVKPRNRDKGIEITTLKADGDGLENLKGL